MSKAKYGRYDNNNNKYFSSVALCVTVIYNMLVLFCNER
jgi:hypothetical protein